MGKENGISIFSIAKVYVMCIVLFFALAFLIVSPVTSKAAQTYDRYFNSLDYPCMGNLKEIVIAEDMDLGGKTWILPNKSRLIFNGGSIKNGMIVFSNTSVESTGEYVPVFEDILFTGTVKNCISPSWFTSSRLSETELVQNCITVCSIIDLKGKVYNTGRLNLRPGICLCNGTLVSMNTDFCLYGVNVHGLELVNLTIDGKGKSACGVFVSDSKNVVVKNVRIIDFYSKDNSAAGIYYRRCNNSAIVNCRITNIVGEPNGRIGDAAGVSRAIILQHCFKMNVSGNMIDRIISSEDGDGIHVINEADNELGNIEIKNNTIKNCSRRLIKVQAPGVNIESNQFITDDNSFDLNYTISLFSSSCSVTNNLFRASSSVPIQIGGKGVEFVSNIVVSNNDILDTGKGNQGAVTAGSPVSFLKVIDNVITLEDTNECGVYLRRSCRNVQICRNNLSGGRGMVFIREDNSGARVEDIIISNNVAETSGYFFALAVSNEKEKVSKIEINNNEVELSNPTYQGDAIIVTPVSAHLRNQIRVNKNTSSNSTVFNRKVRGSTASRPTKLLNKDNKGYRYYDESLGRTVIWNGFEWK